MKIGEEKRVLPRISFDMSIRYYKKGEQKHNNTIGKDISHSGIGFISNEFIPKDSQLIFEIRPPWQPEPIQKIAEVVWISSQPYSERFNVGAKFLS